MPIGKDSAHFFGINYAMPIDSKVGYSPVPVMPQDFSGQNLQGRSFKGQDLTGANFSDADIRGADFSQATLQGANFSHAQAGLPLSSVIKLLLLSLSLSALSGFILVLNISAQGASLIYLPVLITSGVVVVFVSINVRQDVELGVGAALMAAIGIMMVAVIVAITGAASAVTATVIALTVFLTSKEVTYAGTKAWAMAAFLAIMMAFIVVVIPEDLEEPLIFERYVIVAVLALIFYIYSCTSPKNEINNFIGETAIFFSSLGGTIFFEADLTEANFTKAILRSANFKKTNLTRTCWHKAKHLHRARLSDSILADTSVRQLLVSSDGDNKNYEGKNLRGANLTKVNLNQANLKNADISQATLQSANLEWAILTQVQAIGTDFTNAYLTGAYGLGTWNIDSTTTLEQVDCRFVYLLENSKPGTDDRERRPSSGEFAPGEFTKLFQEVLHTVDLIFRNGIDWKAFVTAFNKVQVEHEGKEIAVHSIENKGDGVVVIRVNVPLETDKATIHSRFMQNYELALKAIEDKYKAELKGKHEQLTIYRQENANMKEIINQLASRPIIIINESRSQSESKSMSEASKYDQSHAQFAGGFAETVHGDQIGGTIHNYA
ncbi:MAG: pentapeptide repeat-containing protein, partial [Coleofasciculus sp.]|uniref:pentapeptide repeat-containing protein n=1 Tax=Coleofasciculus sp. TaxID=3100458 RepID=UPI003A26ED5C